MAKVTYYLGAGASYNACPILDKQAEMMFALANYELAQEYDLHKTSFNFVETEYKSLPDNNKIQILWHIGYFGKIAQNFNTIDTYARKLHLSGSKDELNLLKMSVSVFFDLWENFYETRYSHFYLDSKFKKNYRFIDQRYTSLFSVLLDRIETKLSVNESFKFISWNYDLQLESAFKSFMRADEVKNYEQLDNHFKFKEDTNSKKENDVFHLNGHRGFFADKTRGNYKEYELKIYETIEQYWSGIDWLYNSVTRGYADFHKYLKYAWEHKLNDDWFKKIGEILKQTEILVIVGYSFPAFNRRIDQFLFSHLNHEKIIKIVYQDPKAHKQIIENLFIEPHLFEKKIEIVDKVDQFYLPNEHFIVQKAPVSFSFRP